MTCSTTMAAPRTAAPTTGAAGGRPVHAVSVPVPVPVPVSVGSAAGDELGGHELDDAVEQDVLVRGVPIDRHRVAGEGLPEPAHRQCLDTVLVDDLQGDGENLLAGQRGAPAGRLRSAGRAGVIGFAGHQVPGVGDCRLL